MSTPWYDFFSWNNFREKYDFSTYPVNGDDIAMPFHTPVTAVFSGTITDMTYHPWGGQLIIKADNPSLLSGIPYYYYEHLDDFQGGLSVGDHVNVGDVIGLSGGQNTGGDHPAANNYSNGPHIMIGESKYNGVPYTLDTITQDLNPEWIIGYAQSIHLNSGYGQYNSGTTKNGVLSMASSPCPSGYKPVYNLDGSISHCSDGKGGIVMPSTNSTPNNPTPIIGPVIDWLNNFFNQFQNTISWISNPNRIIKLIAGFILLAGCIFILAFPEQPASQVVQRTIKKAGIK